MAFPRTTELMARLWALALRTSTALNPSLFVHGPGCSGPLPVRSLAALLVLAVGLCLTGFQGPAEEFERAIRAYEAGNYIEAYVQSKRAIENRPGDPFCRQIYGLSLAALKQYDEAEESLRAAIEIKPDQADFYYNLGYVLVLQKDYANAIDPLERAVEMDGENLMARFLLGRALVLGHRAALIGDFSERALEQFTAVAAKDPDFPGVHYHLARVHINEGRTKEAREEFEEELRFHPDSPLALLDYGELLLEQGDAESALNRLLRARELQPEMPFLHHILSKVFQRLERPVEAVESAREAVRLSPENPEAHYQLALLYRETGQLEQAREELRIFQDLKKRQEGP